MGDRWESVAEMVRARGSLEVDSRLRMSPRSRVDLCSDSLVPGYWQVWVRERLLVSMVLAEGEHQPPLLLAQILKCFVLWEIPE